MSDLLVTKSGNVFDPHLVRGIVKFPGKGVVFRNEYNKTMVYEPEPDPIYQDVIVKVVVQILRAGKNWQHPDWDAEYAKADKARVEAKGQPKTGTDSSRGV